MSAAAVAVSASLVGLCVRKGNGRLILWATCPSRERAERERAALAKHGLHALFCSGDGLPTSPRSSVPEVLLERGDHG